jgi:hypothetical protein
VSQSSVIAPVAASSANASCTDARDRLISAAINEMVGAVPVRRK